MLKHDNAIVTGEDEDTTKELATAQIGKTYYAMTTVTHHKDGKSIIYRRQKRAPNRAYAPFNVSILGIDERISLGLALMGKGWDVTQVSAFVGMPFQAFRDSKKT